MNKNPFEIRTDLLVLAQNHLEAQYKANVEFAKTMLEATLKAGAELPEAFAKTYRFPTMEDVMAEAKKMYTFVVSK
jgi:hypothetical protein